MPGTSDPPSGYGVKRLDAGGRFLHFVFFELGGVHSALLASDLVDQQTEETLGEDVCQ